NVVFDVKKNYFSDRLLESSGTQTARKNEAPGPEFIEGSGVIIFMVMGRTRVQVESRRRSRRDEIPSSFWTGSCLLRQNRRDEVPPERFV
ncbi:MAG: hypothetical protein WEE20_01340, partial [Bacteroidota bacterium]